MDGEWTQALVHHEVPAMMSDVLSNLGSAMKFFVVHVLGYK